MSFTDQSADGVQPDSGQGESGGQPYADYLDRVPEEVRGDIEPIFSDWNSHVNKQFEQHAGYRKQWEPYEQLGVHEQNPENLQALLDFQQALENNPQGVWEWAQGYAKERGLYEEPAPAEQPAEDFSYLDPNQQYEKVLEQKLGPLQKQFEQFEQWRNQLEEAAREQQEQQEHERQVAEISSALEHEIGQLAEKHAANLPEKMREQFGDILERFAYPYADEGLAPGEVVQKAFADFQNWQNLLQTDALQAKVDAPAPAQSGGTPDGSPPSLGKGRDALREAEKIAREQLRANRAA